MRHALRFHCPESPHLFRDMKQAQLQALSIPLLAPSLGSVETLITQPALTTHVGLTPEEMKVRDPPVLAPQEFEPYCRTFHHCLNIGECVCHLSY